jgi:arsenite/tail-anchored protein-transporting ATPase
MPLTGLDNDALKLILFGGKGGVGKTTCASSTGFYLAGQYKTLLISTDPAHSLSDCFGQSIGDAVTGIDGVQNLSAIEVSADKALCRFKTEYGDEIRWILDSSTYLDKADIDSVFALSIPGIDEVMGFKTILDLVEEGKFDKYIVDTAPTGHALRLLTLPGILDDWIKVVAKMRWKYHRVVEAFSGGAKTDRADEFLVEMKKVVKRIEGLLHDGRRCEFIVVTIPEEMAIAETERLVNSLRVAGINVKQMVVNNVVRSSDCDFCKMRRKGQERYIKLIKEKFGTFEITLVPLQPVEVRGIESLDNFRHVLLGA